MNIRDAIKMGVPRNDGSSKKSFWRKNGKSHVGVSEISYYNHNPLKRKKKKHLFDKYQLPSGKLS